MMNPSPAKKYWPYLFPVFLLMTNFILKIIFLDARDIAMDEPFTIFYAQADLKDIFSMLPHENNPPFFFLLLHYWITLFGISPFSVRFLPFAFSVVTALVIYQTGRRFFSMKMGVVASLIFTFSNYQMIFAHEARVYSLFGLLTVCSMYLFLMLAKKTDSISTLLLLAGVNILLVYSHFFGFMVIAIQIVTLLLIRYYRERIWKFYLISMGLVIVAYMPYLPVLIFRYTVSAGSGTWVSPPVISDLYTMLWRYCNAPVTTVFMIGILVVAFLFWLFRQRRGNFQGSPEGKFLVIWFLVPYLSMFLVSFQIPLFLDRYTVFISIGFYLLVALAVESLSVKKWIFISLSAMAILLMVVTFNPNVDNKRRLKEAVSRVEAFKGTETVVIVCPSWLEYGFAYHWRPDCFRDYKNTRMLLHAEKIYPVNSLDELDPNILKTASSVVYFEEWATLVDKNNRIITRLSSGFPHRKDHLVYENFFIHHFTKIPNP